MVKIQGKNQYHRDLCMQAFKEKRFKKIFF